MCKHNFFDIKKIQKAQEAEKDRQDREGFCRTICVGLENLGGRSGERAIWELVQNARDMDEHAHICIHLSDKNLIFSHKGKPFDFTSLYNLVTQKSSKRGNEVQAGQYGTGFMTTHAFNKKVYVSGPYEIVVGNNSYGFIMMKDFVLDRTKVDTEDGPTEMYEEIQKIYALLKQERIDTPKSDITSFRYELTSEQIEGISNQLLRVMHLMPFVLVLNSRICDVVIIDDNKQRKVKMTKASDLKHIPLGADDVWEEISQTIQIEEEGNVSERLVCKSLQSSKGDVIIIPPYPSYFGTPYNIPSLFLWFPLLGTEKFGVNFIFHSKRFYPVERRNNIMLPAKTEEKRNKGGKNEEVLKEMMNVLFEYYSNAENCRDLDISMCKVCFKTEDDDETTKEFYAGLQNLWKEKIPNWKIIPTDEGLMSMTDSRVRVLHPDFYKNFDVEKRKFYEHILNDFAKKVEYSNGCTYLIPNQNLIEWSETVKEWGCTSDKEFFITIEDVCKAIKDKEDSLHSFLMFLKQ